MIDAANAPRDLAPESAASVFGSLCLGSSTETKSASLQTAVDYRGRGVLTKALLMEKDSAGTSPYNARLRIMLDGYLVWDDAATLTRESQLRVVVGDELTFGPGRLGVSQAAGLSFNERCRIEYSSDGERETVIGWHLSKLPEAS